jgi:pimeloyl-ACP methyl ester carboxylesterase
MSTGNIQDASSGSLASTLMTSAALFTWRMGSLVAGLGAVVATILYFKQDSLLYFPEIGGIPRRPDKNPRRYRSPGEHQIPFETHRIACADGVYIHSWLLLRGEAKNIPTLLFFHGNAGNIGLRLPNAMQMLQYLNVNVLMVEYRGYGDSDSVTPSEAGLKLDAEAALKFITQHPNIDNSKVFLFGRSLGGAVAFHLAKYAEENSLPLAGVIVENTFLGISQMVDHLLPYVAPFKALVLRIAWDSSKIAPTLQTPVLYLAGAKDTLVPHSHMLDLFKTTKQSRLLRIHVVPDGTHNDTWMQGGQAYWEAILAFLAQATDKKLSYTSNDTSTPFGSSIDQSLLQRRVSANLESDGTIGSASSSIPIMPSNILGMARESIREGSTGTSSVTPSKKEI